MKNFTKDFEELLKEARKLTEINDERTLIKMGLEELIKKEKKKEYKSW